MNSDTQKPRPPYGFALGLLTGAMVGAGLAMWLVPRAVAELRQRVIESARSLAQRVGEEADQARAVVGDTAEELTRRSQVVRDNIAEAVAHHAHEVEAYAIASQSKRVAGPSKRSSNNRTAPASDPPEM